MERNCPGFTRLDLSFLFRILKLDFSKSYSEILLTKKRRDSPNLEKIPETILLGGKRGCWAFRIRLSQTQAVPLIAWPP